MPARPPKKVRVGNHQYALIVDQQRCEDMDTRYGFTLPARAQIVVNPDMAESQLKDTILHEVLHAIVDEAALGEYKDAPKGAVLSEQMEERVVRALTPALIAFFRNNKALITYLQE